VHNSGYRIRDFSASVAKIVRGVPAFVPDWPLVDAEPLAPPHVALRRL
jgi:hypothetical protein